MSNKKRRGSRARQDGAGRCIRLHFVYQINSLVADQYRSQKRGGAGRTRDDMQRVCSASGLILMINVKTSEPNISCGGPFKKIRQPEIYNSGHIFLCKSIDKNLTNVRVKSHWNMKNSRGDEKRISADNTSEGFSILYTVSPSESLPFYSGNQKQIRSKYKMAAP